MAESRKDAAPTTEQLRAAIDRGETRDKVVGSDPAASPLGTDDEAAGAPPSPEAREIAMRAETDRAGVAAGRDPDQEGRVSGRATGGRTVAVIGAMLVAALVLLLLYL
jgi:hypothetical protein